MVEPIGAVMSCQRTDRSRKALQGDHQAVLPEDRPGGLEMIGVMELAVAQLTGLEPTHQL